MTYYEITSGRFTRAEVGSPAVFEGTTTAVYPVRVVGVNYSTNGIYWGGYPTFLGDTPQTTLPATADRIPGQAAEFTSTIIPSFGGYSTVYMRALLSDGLQSDPIAVPLQAYSSEGYLAQLEAESSQALTDGWPDGWGWASGDLGGFSDGGITLSMSSYSGSTTACRIGGAGAVEFLRPGGSGSGSALARTSAAGEVSWMHWFDSATNHIVRNDSAGRTYILADVTGVTRTLKSTAGATLVTMSGVGHVRAYALVRLSVSGAVEYSATITMAGTDSGVPSMDLVVGSSRNAVVLRVPPGITSVTYPGGTQTTTVSGSEGVIVVSLSSTFAFGWAAFWERGMIGDSPSVAVLSDSRVCAVVKSIGVDNPVFGGTTASQPTQIAMFTSSGSLSWAHNTDVVRSNGTRRLVADTTGVFLVGQRYTSGDRTDGSVTVTAGASGDHVLVGFAESDGAAVWGNTSYKWSTGAVRGSSLWAVENGAPLRVRKIDTATGTLVWTATTSETASATIAPDVAGNLRLSVLTEPSGAQVLGNSDLSTVPLPAPLPGIGGLYGYRFKLLATLSPTGFWSAAVDLEQGPDDGPGGTASVPTVPVASFPTTRIAGDSFTVGVTGRDPQSAVDVHGIPVLKIIDPTTGMWVDASSGLTFAGLGTVTTTVDPVGSNGGLSGALMWDSDPDYVGVMKFRLCWGMLEIGQPARFGPGKTFYTSFLSVAEAPDAPTGDMPDIDEDDDASIGTFTFDTDPNRTGTYTWQVSRETSGTHTHVGDEIVVYDGGSPVGRADVLSQSGHSARIRFRPYPNWNGSASFDVRVGNGRAYSTWTTAYVTVSPVTDRPSAPSFTLPDVAEDGTATFTVTWTDPDGLDMRGRDYELVLGNPALDGGGAIIRTNGTADLQARSTSDQIQVGPIGTVKARVRVLSKSTTEKKMTLIVEPAKNVGGAYHLAIRVDRRYGARRYSKWTDDSATITLVPDAPEPVQGSMPTARRGQNVEGRFWTVDPDASTSSLTFQVATVDAPGTWSSSITVPGAGGISVIDSDTSNTWCQVRLTQTVPATLTSYSFLIRVTDNTGLSSAPVPVLGSIIDGSSSDEDGTGAGVWLQRVVRTSGTATVELLCPLKSLTSLSTTTALDGPGSADFTVSASEIARRAAGLGMSVQDLLEPDAIEVAIYTGPVLEFQGPIDSVSWSATDDSVDVTAKGLLSYLQGRFPQPGDDPAPNTDIATIIGDVVVATQARPWGGLAITDGTGTSGANLTYTFDQSRPIWDAVGDLCDHADSVEVWVDGSRTLHAASRRGTDKSSLVRLTKAMCSVAEWNATGGKVITSCTVLGSGSFNGSFTAGSAALAKHGVQDAVVRVDQLGSNAACTAMAERIVGDSLRGAESITVTVHAVPGRPFFVGDITPGDGVYVDLIDVQLGQILGKFRIINKTLTMVGAGGGSYVMDLDLEPFVVDAAHPNGRMIGSRAAHNPAMVTRLSALEVLARRQA